MFRHDVAWVRYAAAFVLLALVLPLGGCGGDGEDGAAPLGWKGDPDIVVPPRLPGDRILRGEVTNGSLDRVVVDAKDVKLLDGDGRRVEATATFLSSYVHSIYPPTNRPAPYPAAERERLGQIAQLEPGQSAPLTVSWHEPKGPRTPVRLDYGNGSLPIPHALASGRR
jgi:hypothetical protein